FLDVAVAAEAFERLSEEHRAALAHPVLADSGGEPREVSLARVSRGRTIVGTREPHHEQRGGLGLDAEIGEHVLHERLLDEALPECGPMRAVVYRLRHRLPHRRRRPDDAVEPRVRDHFDDGWHAAPVLAHHARPGTVEFDLARRVGTIAELVLE